MTDPTATPLLGIEIALLIFFAVFVLITTFTCLRRRGHYDGASRIPLDDGATTVKPSASGRPCSNCVDCGRCVIGGGRHD